MRDGNTPVPLPDPLGVAEMATEGAIRDPLRVLDREAARAEIRREREREQQDIERESGQDETDTGQVPMGPAQANGPL